ncbi:cobalamin synthase [Escherichia coli]|uniref:Adenosylcobinamide-GDP ribazoletransferase n=1 Tax=Escherichia coli TaxID=562 RepID=A0A377B942_ECOLX|nr:cobalamin synthase [Escherichia coli]
MSKLFWAMLSFITRLPVPRRWSQGLDFEHYSRGIITFPLIGLLLGAISGLVFMVLQAWCGAPLAALFSVLVLVLMTGGFHLDGLADTCDGVFSARSRDRMLEIMRDSRLGTHGGLALIFVVLAKILVLSELALRGESILASLAAACAGQPRDYRIIDVSSSLCAGRRAWQCVSLAKLMGDKPASHSLSRYFCCRIIAGYAWCGCYGGDDGGDFHPRSASQTYAGRANGRYAGSSHRAW